MDMREIRFGVEIETVRQTRKRVAEAIQGVVGGTVSHVGRPACYDAWAVHDRMGRVWNVVSDGSLTSVPSTRRAEVVSPVLTSRDIPELQQVVRALRAAGARSSSQCGIHVHVDAEAFDGRTLSNLAKIVFKQEELIIRALGVSRSRLARYARKTRRDFIRRLEQCRPRTREALNRLWYGYRNTAPQHYDSTRYHGVNLHSVWYRGTVEFRWFNGTLHAGKVKAYVQFCLAIVAKALNARGASSKQRQPTGTSDRYDFRVFLLRLKLIGREFKTARRHLMANLAGSAAWEYGQPNRTREEAVTC